MFQQLNERRRTSKFHHLRWCIGGLLMASTIINYIDRQTLSSWVPTLRAISIGRIRNLPWVLIAFSPGVWRWADGRRASFSIGLERASG
jgi:hypothetical protein